MAAPDSKYQAIVDALLARFAAIREGADYHFTPDRVVPCSYFDEKAFALDIGRCVYFLAPGEEQYSEEGTGDDTSGGSMKSEADFILVLARQHTSPTENPYREDDPTRWRIANRMVRDAIRALFADVTLGGLAINIITESLVVDRAKNMPGWAVVELQFTVQYSFLAATP